MTRRPLDTSGFPAWLWLWAPLLWFPMQFAFRN